MLVMSEGSITIMMDLVTEVHPHIWSQIFIKSTIDPPGLSDHSLRNFSFLFIMGIHFFCMAPRKQVYQMFNLTKSLFSCY